MDDLNRLIEGRQVLVTGGGANIGRATVLEMARQGATVYFVDRNLASCNTLEEELRSLSLPGKGFVADLSRQSEIDQLHTRLLDQGIVIDTLINNVGIEFGDDSTTVDLWERWQTTFSTNVIGPRYLTQLLTQGMIERSTPGAVVFMSSIHQWTRSRDTSYAASKAAVGAIVEQLAVELAPHRIRVKAIAPGYTGTDEEGQVYPHYKTPLEGTSVAPEYIARAVVYLVSEYFSKHTTGSILKIDGALSLQNHLSIPTPPAPLWRRVASKIRRLTPF